MSRKSIEKQRQKNQVQQEISRRKWLKIGLFGGGALTLGGIGFFSYNQLRVPSYSEAYDDIEKRQRWLEGLESRSYVEKRIVTSVDLEEMKRRLDYIPEKIDGILPFADTITYEEEMATKGAKSILYVYPESCFDPQIKDFKKSLGIIVENVIKNHELIHADHYNQGIEGYPSEWFHTIEGKINIPLFMAITEIVCHHSEWLGLEKLKNKGKFEEFYQSKIKDLALPYFLQINNLTKNKELIEKAKKEIWF